MAQVRLVQIGTASPGTNIQIGGIGRTLTNNPSGTNIQLGKFNNTTGTFYKDPTNPSGGGLGQQIQVGTHISNRTLGYITGSGLIQGQSIIATQTATGAGYFSIWNAGAVQGGFQIQVPTCTGQQVKAQGSISNQPAKNQPLVNQPLVNQAAVNQAAKNQPLVNQAAKNQPLVNQAAKNQPFNQQPPAYFDGTYYPGNFFPGFGYYDTYFPGNYVPPVYYPPNYYAGVQQPLVQQPLVQQPLVQQPLVNQPLVNQAAVNQAAKNQPLVNQPLVNQAAVQNPATNQAATGTLTNGSWVNTAPGTVQNTGGFTISIANIGTLTTQGGTLQGTGAGGSFQFPGTYTRTTSAAVTTQQGIVNFQGTTRN